MTQEDVTQLERRLEFGLQVTSTNQNEQNQLKMKFFSFILDTKIGDSFYFNLINRGYLLLFIII